VAIRFQRVIPLLRIFNVDKAREFYVDFLGFSVDFEHRLESNAPLIMQVSRGDLVIRLSEHYGDSTPGAAFQIDVTGIDDLAAELAAKRYRYSKPAVLKTPWNTRVLSLIDPFSNRLTFSEVIAS
jgi:uncharacterized glyoxalase superfamily protein PhnB